MKKSILVLSLAAALSAVALTAGCASMTVTSFTAGVAAGIQTGEAAVDAYCKLPLEQRREVRAKITNGKQILCASDPAAPATPPPGTLPAPSS